MNRNKSKLLNRRKKTFERRYSEALMKMEGEIKSMKTIQNKSFLIIKWLFGEHVYHSNTLTKLPHLFGWNVHKLSTINKQNEERKKTFFYL